MKLVSVETTDDQWLGLEFTLPDPLMGGVAFDFPVTSDIIFNVQKSDSLGNGYYRYSSPNYVVIAKEVV